MSTTQPPHPLKDDFENLWRRLRARLGRRRQPPALPGDEASAVTAHPSTALERSTTVAIPALNEARRIAEVVRYALSDPATAEVIVIDDSSLDDTANLARSAGARVITSSMLGKGASMRDALAAAKLPLIVFLDGDLAGLRPGIVSDLVRPLLEDRADFVKARFGRSGGRVTELTAKPMLKVFFPELAHLAQPLGGIIAARLPLLQSLSFEDGYGVDIGLLLGAFEANARIAEVDIGSLEHDSQALADLTAMANEVARVIHQFARRLGRFHIDQLEAMYEAQRQAAGSITQILLKRRGRRRLLLIDMDGSLIETSYVHELARQTNREAELKTLLADRDSEDSAMATRVAQVFRFVHRQDFIRTAQALPLASGAVEFVNRMRRAGFMVGVLSDGYFIAAEIIRRRVFADFALAHLMNFRHDVATGELSLNPAFLPPSEEPDRSLCKAHVLRHFRNEPSEPGVLEIWAIGDNGNDLAMLKAADVAFTLNPRRPELRNIPGIHIVRSFDELLAHVPEPYQRQD